MTEGEQIGGRIELLNRYLFHCSLRKQKKNHVAILLDCPVHSILFFAPKQSVSSFSVPCSFYPSITNQKSFIYGLVGAIDIAVM